MAAYGAWNAAIRLALRGYVLNRLMPVCEHTPRACGYVLTV